MKMMMEKLHFACIGKSGGNLTHDCVFCFLANSLSQECKLDCLYDLHTWHLKYEEVGGDKKKQKDFQNIMNKPLLKMELDNFILGTVAS